MTNVYDMRGQVPVAHLEVDARSAFVTRTYLHLFGAILGFTAIEVFLFSSGLAEIIASSMLGTSWLLVLGFFMVASWLATRVAHTSTSMVSQYAALIGFTFAEALIFVPLLYMAQYYAPGVIQSAALVTLVGFSGLTAVAFTSSKDFSFLGSVLKWGGILALVLIVSSVLFGFHLGTLFSVGMIALAGGAILYDTSNVLRTYPEDRYVGASLQLFASVALMFWYVLRLFMSRDD